MPRIRGQVLKQIYRVWLVRRLLPVVIFEIVILGFVLYMLGHAVFVERIIDNGLKVFFLNPTGIFSFAVASFIKTRWITKILTILVVVFVALVIRHITQGILRFILVKENYFGKLPKDK